MSSHLEKDSSSLKPEFNFSREKLAQSGHVTDRVFGLLLCGDRRGSELSCSKGISLHDQIMSGSRKYLGIYVKHLNQVELKLYFGYMTLFCF